MYCKETLEPLGGCISKVHKVWYPEIMDLSNWDGKRDSFTNMSDWINAVAQRYNDISYSQSMWSDLDEEQRKMKYDAVADILTGLRDYHLKNSHDILSEEDWDSDFNSILDILEEELSW